MRTFSDVLDIITPQPTTSLCYTGSSPPQGPRIFGGQVVAQCLLAANQTVDPLLMAHSLHAYFLRAGDPNSPIEFEVDPIRDGQSFCTRRVVARQHNRAIFNTSISYHKQEEGPSHSCDMPAVEPPNFAPLATSAGSVEAQQMLDTFGFERQRLVTHEDQAQEPKLANWFRLRGDLPPEPRLHQAALALLSDFSLLSTVFLPVSGKRWHTDFMFASLDHALWFHAPVDMTAAVLYACESPWAANARGFSRGSLWSPSGRLIASVAQEGLMRPKTR